MKFISFISLFLISINAEGDGNWSHCNSGEMEEHCLSVVHERIMMCGGDMSCKCAVSQELMQCYSVCPNRYEDVEEAQMEITSYCSYGMGPGPGIPVVPGPPVIANPAPSLPPGVAQPQPSLPSNPPPAPNPSSWAHQPIPTNVATPSGIPPTMVPPPPLSPNNQSQNNGQIQGSWTYSTGYGNHNSQNPNMGQGPFSSRRNSAANERASIITVAILIFIAYYSESALIY